MTRHFLYTAMVALAATATAQAQNVTLTEAKAAPIEQGVLASAKNLYASASYEAALLQLSSPDSKEDPDQVDTYRALCFLALDRQKDAEQTLEGLVTRKPLYAINDSDFSPRLVSIFRDVRKRVLPGAAVQMYSAAKSDYEDKNYAPAVAKFKQLMAVLNDPDVSDPSGRLGDLRELADGFLKLSEQRLGDAPPAAAVMRPAATMPAATNSAATTPGVAARPSSAAVVPPTASPTPGASPAPAATAVAPSPMAARAYTAVDVGVEQPIVVQQGLPSWRAPQQSQYLRNRAYTGRLEVLIDERGRVERATVVKPVWPTYDPLLLEAAKTWSYRPAQKDGKPVKFVKQIDITVNTGTIRP